MSAHANDWDKDKWYLLGIAIFAAIWLVVFLVLTIRHDDDRCLDSAPHAERDHCVVIG